MTRLSLLALLLPVPVFADNGLFSPPEGCVGTLTVQTRGCSVEHHWECAVDAPGEKWRIVFRQDGPQFLGKIDYETQWLETYDLFPTRRDVLVLPANDPASFTELLETGTDTYDFMQQSESGTQRYVGVDRIVERDIVIDGEPLMRTEYKVEATDDTGAVVFEMEGSEYISEEHRRFFGGAGSGRDPDGTYNFDETPVAFIYPGEPGFFSKQPLYGCEATNVRISIN